MKYLYLLFATLSFFTIHFQVKSQCTNSISFTTHNAPSDNISTQLTTCTWQNEYNIITNVVAGETYVSSMSCTGYITVRSGSYNGAVVDHGNTALTWTATTSGTHYIHYNTNSSCGTASTCCDTYITCTSCPAPTIPPQDCEGAIMVCDNNTFNGDAVDHGDLYEIDEFSNTGCDMDSENQSTWFYVNIGTGGTLEMTIAPSNSGDDYDWSIWGPFTETTANLNCPPVSGPIRCNTSANTALTGMNTTATNDEEFPGTSTYEWSNPLNVSAGEVYILMVDNWSASGNPFDLDWGGSAELNCDPVNLPVDLLHFNGETVKLSNNLSWSTATETNNDYFILEYSSNGEIWSEIEEIAGAGNSNIENTYSTFHRDFENGVNYYRLKQVDFDGTINTHNIISIDNTQNGQLLKRVNTMGQEVGEGYKGIVFEYYSNGNVKQVYQN